MTDINSLTKLNFLHIIKNSSKLTSVSVISSISGFIINIFIARRLGPKGYGLAGFVLLFLQYAGLIRLGFIDSGFREWIAHRSRGEEIQAQKIQNVAITDEFLFNIVPFSLLFIAGFFFAERFYRFGFWIASFLLIILIIDRIFGSVHISYERFNLSARNRLIVTLFGPLLSLLLVFYLGSYALLIAPLIAVGASVLVWFLLSPSINYKPDWDFVLTHKLALIGLPLSLSGFFYNAARMADRTVVASFLSAEALGYFNFGSAIVLAIAMVITDFSTVLTPILLGEISQNGFIAEVKTHLKTVIVYTVIIVGLLTNILQACIGAFIILFAPKFTPSIALLNILAFNLLAFQLMVIPEIILQSKNVQRQWTVLILYISGAVFVLLGGFLAIKSGTGLIGIAVISVLAQLIISLIGNTFIGRYLFAGQKEKRIHYLKLGIIVSTAVITMLVMTALDGFVVGKFNIVVTSVLKMFLVMSIWGIMIRIYFQKAGWQFIKLLLMRQNKEGV